MTRLLGGTASHVGNVREANQDRVFFDGDVAALADGMGGHQGGERAAELAIGQFREAGPELTESALVDVVIAANRQVHGHAADNGLPGMGTTVVALTLHHDGTITVANVGDSRAYWLRGDYMGQITEDHSFVEDLVRQGRLTPQEAAIHPQRNILTRAVGIGAEVEVDRFPIEEPQVGDRFLLCSDGLFNELAEEEILEILLAAGHPAEAAEALVEATLRTPCRDNVTVAVVELVADDDPRLEAQAVDHDQLDDDGIVTDEYIDDRNALTAPMPVVSKSVLQNPVEGGRNVPPPAPGADQIASNGSNGSGPHADMSPASVAARARPGTLLLTDELSIDDEPIVEAEDPELYLDTSEMDIVDDDPELVHPRSRLVLVGGAVLLLAALAIGGYLGARAYAGSGYFIAEDDATGQLAVFEGRRGGFLGFDPSIVSGSDHTMDMLTESERASVAASRFDQPEAAQAVLDQIDERLQDDLAQAEAAQLAEVQAAEPSTGNVESGDSSQSEATLVPDEPSGDDGVSSTDG